MDAEAAPEMEAVEVGSETPVATEALPEVEPDTATVAEHDGSPVDEQGSEHQGDEGGGETPAPDPAEIEDPDSSADLDQDAKAFLDELADKFEAMQAEHESRVAELEAANAALRDRLLSSEIENVKRAEKRTLHESAVEMLDKSKLMDDDGMPDRDAITRMVHQFGTKWGKFADQLGLGPQGHNSFTPPQGQGYGNAPGYNHKLDARYR